MLCDTAASWKALYWLTRDLHPTGKQQSVHDEPPISTAVIAIVAIKTSAQKKATGAFADNNSAPKETRARHKRGPYRGPRC